MCMMREDCWCSEDEEYVAGVLEAKFIMWRLCAGVFRRNGCDAKSSVCLKRVNAVIGVLVFAGIKQLNELFAGNGMIGFVAKERVDGKLVLSEAVQIMKPKAD